MPLARISGFLPSASAAYPQTDSPKVIPHQSFVGFALILSNAAAVVTVEVGGSKDGPFPIAITLEGTAEFRYPASDQMNILYNAPYIRITWDVGTLQIFHKG